MLELVFFLGWLASIYCIVRRVLEQGVKAGLKAGLKVGLGDGIVYAAWYGMVCMVWETKGWGS